jgi:biofilm PGA synthesis lipoprotein PgaB
MTADRTPKHRRPAALRGRRRRLTRGLLSVTVGFGLIALVLGYLIVPGVWQWKEGEAKVTAAQANIVEQNDTTIAGPVDPSLVAALRSAPSSPQSAPLILTYHDIGYNPSPYTVTPEAFATQMQLLNDAGWTTTTGAQLSEWLAGKPLPPHSVMISFDDGARGVWQYADPILARNQQHAIAYIITGYVGTRAPYYMTWPEIIRLQASGRWDIGSHTHLGHVQVPIDANGNEGPYVTKAQYLVDQHRVETSDEYSARIRNDLVESIDQLVAHGLPRPTFFAYPFSANAREPSSAIVASLFQAAMLDDVDVRATSSRDIMEGNLSRMDVLANLSLEEWAARLVDISPLDPGAAQPFTRRGSWTTNARTASPLPGRDDQPIILEPGPEDHTAMLFAPYQTTMWQNYTVAADVSGFSRPGDGTTAGLIALARDPRYQVEVTISVGAYQVLQAFDNQHIVASGTLPEQLSYRVEMTVRHDIVTVTIDGRPAFDLPIPALGPHVPAGGIAITGTRLYRDSPPPHFTSLEVRGF